MKVNWTYVETAFERNSPDLHSYIERATGDVLVVVDGQAEDEENRKRIAVAPDQFVRIDPASSREQYRWMEQFVASLDDPQLRERLLVAIDGKGAFRRFKDVLLSYPQERERWFNYRAALLQHHINQWFSSKGLEPEPLAPWGDVTLPEEPAEPLQRIRPSGESVTDVLRKQVANLVESLPACELHSARAFLEYLRDRGTSHLLGAGEPAEVLADPTEVLADPVELSDEADSVAS